ncbi:hypothetical protein ICN49_11045 [Polynucleobacter sp. MWH-Mekk-B1]|uniref:hypothetical protein n=1 Tax=Polynucleobacter finlandensis TaxID=1855894 RepID=UPI001C0BD4B0|nr:hypothetical protein [Polynucleobacter finlandensis]MBU3545457.1 hypothetical protein [Polynucleobacter finlandensis]
MNESLQTLFQCADDVQHYFRALGGANQYPGFMNWHIPAFVILVSADETGSELLPDSIWRCTEKIQGEIRSRFINIPPEPQDLADFIATTCKQVMKFKDPKESLNWLGFCESIKND